MGGVEDVVVCIFRTRTIEIGRGEGACMKREGVDDATFVTSPHELGLVSYRLVGNVLGGLGLAKLVDEDEWVVPKVSRIKFLPAIARVVSVSEGGERMVACAGDGDGTGCKAAMNDRGGRVRGWLFFVQVMKKDISEGGNIEEVKDVVVLLDVDVEGFILESLVSKYHDGGEETVRPGIKGFGQK
jgi:hypothetical protein